MSEAITWTVSPPQLKCTRGRQIELFNFAVDVVVAVLLVVCFLDAM
jgi:hypothetical protein